MRVRSIGISVIAAMVLVSCVSEDKPPVHLQIDYQLRCIPNDKCFSLPDENPHVLNGIDNLDGLTLDCEFGSDTTRFGFLAAFVENETSYEINLDGTGSKCTLSITEGNSDFSKDCEITEGGRADCTDASMKANAPCRVAVEKDGDNAVGTICCRSIPSGFGATLPQDGDLSLVRSGTFDRPATFEIENCR
jgi:hypothetical protein